MGKIDPVIDSSEISFETYRAAGPGGQNVNKVATAVRLRFNLKTASLPDEVKARLARLAGKRLTDDGILIIEAQRFRTQQRNQQDAVERLQALLQRASVPPKKRRPTRPTAASVRRRLETKKRQSLRKQTRQRFQED
ncbi:MAG: alternative ribosome rescue aminoacyl-tRNA hydrolase ArfB [Candidatus Villigracilaceae bacterium]